MKKVLMTAMMIAMSVGMNAQTVQRQVVKKVVQDRLSRKWWAMPHALALRCIVRRT